MSFFYSPIFKSMVLLPKCTGALSIIGSSAISYDILFRGDRTKKMETACARIVLALSLSDIMYTFWAHILGTWLVPVAGDNPNDPDVFMAAGNRATCTAQVGRLRKINYMLSMIA